MLVNLKLFSEVRLDLFVGVGSRRDRDAFSHVEGLRLQGETS